MAWALQIHQKFGIQLQITCFWQTPSRVLWSNTILPSKLLCCQLVWSFKPQSKCKEHGSHMGQHAELFKCLQLRPEDLPGSVGPRWAWFQGVFWFLQILWKRLSFLSIKQHRKNENRPGYQLGKAQISVADCPHSFSTRSNNSVEPTKLLSSHGTNLDRTEVFYLPFL